MKLTTLLIGLSLATSALADYASVSKTGNSAELSGSGATHEIFTVIATAYEQGFTDLNGANFFEELSTPNRVGGRTLYTNKSISASVRSGITLSYAASFKAKKGEIKLSGKTLTITGAGAKLLLGAMTYSSTNEGDQPEGVGRQSTKSGKVVCSRVVYPNAPTVCVIKL